MVTTSFWANLQDRIGFYTKESAPKIPERPGVYGWFFPLYLYSKDIEEFLGLVASLLNYDASCRSVPSQDAEIAFNWDSLLVTAKWDKPVTVSEEIKKRWAAIIDNQEHFPVFSQALLESSIFLPPLYVGRATNLRERYFQHAEQPNLEKNTFASRFAKHAADTGLSIEVCDLLFVCVLTEPQAREFLRSEEASSVLEKVLMKLSGPPFSVK